jgi:putative transposase
MFFSSERIYADDRSSARTVALDLGRTPFPTFTKGNAFLDRPIEGEWPYLWLDATYLKVRDGGRIFSVAAIIAVASTIEGRREIIGLGIGPSDAEPFWSSFLVKRGLDGVKLVISDAHDGLRHAITRVLGANRRRYRVHWMRNALAHVLRGQRTMIAASICQAFLQTDAGTAQLTRLCCRSAAAALAKARRAMDESEHDVLVYMTFDKERLNKEVKRRADVVGNFPNEAKDHPTHRRGPARAERRVAL